MSSRSLSVVALLALISVTEPVAAQDGVLRACADPNNLPFSNAAGEGFENKLAERVAAALHRRLDYVWWAQRRGFIRNTLRAGACDIVIGVPSDYDLTLNTRPYYRSTYSFVARAGGTLPHSIDDPALHRLRIGVQMIGDDFSNTPPAHALSARGIVGNVVGYTVYGDYRQPNPAGRIVDAVAKGEVDVALVWGPFAGYFAQRESPPLLVQAIDEKSGGQGMPFTFGIAMGVARGNTALRDALDGFIRTHQGEIDALLAGYGVPLLPLEP
jgi:quinoprotein dehydrogenase-associated probable ABC transporter substrate-binding protein